MWGGAGREERHERQKRGQAPPTQVCASLGLHEHLASHRNYATKSSTKDQNQFTTHAFFRSCHQVIYSCTP